MKNPVLDRIPLLRGIHHSIIDSFLISILFITTLLHCTALSQPGSLSRLDWRQKVLQPAKKSELREQPLVEDIHSSPDDVSIGTLLELLENPGSRDRLIEQLRLLASAGEYGKAEPAESVEIAAASESLPDSLSPPDAQWNISGAVLPAIREFMAAAKAEFLRTGAFLRSFTERAELAKESLGDARYTANLRRAIILIIISLMLGTTLSLLLHFLLKRILKTGAPRGTTDRARSRTESFTDLFLFWVTSVAPAIAMFLTTVFFMGIFETDTALDSIASTVIFVAAAYRTIRATAGLLFRQTRWEFPILSLDDQRALLYRTWTMRFLNYGAIFYLVTNVSHLLGFPVTEYPLLNGSLFLVFSIMATMLILRLGRIRVGEIGIKEYKKNQRASRIGPFLSSSAYLVRICCVWVATLFIFSGYGEGIAFLWRATWKTLLTILLVRIVAMILEFGFERIFRINEKIRERHPHLEAKTRLYLENLLKLLDAIIVAFAAVFVLEFWGIHLRSLLRTTTGSTILLRIVAIGSTVLVTIVLLGLIRVAQDHLISAIIEDRIGREEWEKKKKTLIPLVALVLRIVVIFIASIIVLDRLSLNTTPILAGAGILGLAVGFGSQELVKDVINGLFILFENSISVGDVVMIDDIGGIVQSLNLRSVKMRDLAGNLHVIPNGTITRVKNMTKEYSRYLFDVGVAYRENVDEVIEVLREVGEDLMNDPDFQNDILEPLEIMGLDRFADSALIIRARIKTRPLKQWRVGREFNRRMKKVFDERGIEIPFPHRTVYWGAPKEGQASPCEVNLNR